MLLRVIQGGGLGEEEEEAAIGAIKERGAVFLVGEARMRSKEAARGAVAV